MGRNKKFHFKNRIKFFYIEKSKFYKFDIKDYESNFNKNEENVKNENVNFQDLENPEELDDLS